MSKPPINNPHDDKFVKELSRLSVELRCYLGWHQWGDWNQDRHPRSNERFKAYCPLIHWPFMYRTCELCGVAQWAHQPKG